MQQHYDVIILGSGPAGFSCAMQSSKFDKKALIVESNNKFLGGTWINAGTIPSKAFREAAKTILEFNKHFSGESNGKAYQQYRMEDLLRYKDNILKRENKKLEKDLEKNEIDVCLGDSQLIDNHTVRITRAGGEAVTCTTDFILICTGNRPSIPDSFSVRDTEILDYESILTLTHIPHRLVILGVGGYAMEYATIFGALGTRVAVLGRHPGYLPFLDEEIRESFFDSLPNNVSIYSDIQVEEIRFNPYRSYTEVRFRDQKKSDQLQVIETEHVLNLAGRRPDIHAEQLENVDITRGRCGFIRVNDRYQTSEENIYAAGDVIGLSRLVSTSYAQGRQAACNMFDIPSEASSDHIPFGLYTLPEIAKIGLTEKEAQNQGMPVTAGRAYFKNIAKADMINHREGLLKLVFHTETFRLLGVHIVGPDASNLIHLGQAVLAFNGDVRYFIRHVMNYPTLSEAYRIATFNGLNRVYKAGVRYREGLEDRD